jgi:hypothetical protein
MFFTSLVGVWQREVFDTKGMAAIITIMIFNDLRDTTFISSILICFKNNIFKHN